jgi:hypothetical protein
MTLPAGRGRGNSYPELCCRRRNMGGGIPAVLLSMQIVRD